MQKFNIIVIYLFDLCVWAQECHSIFMEIRGQLWESVFSFDHGVPEDCTQVSGLSGKDLLPTEPSHWSTKIKM